MKNKILYILIIFSIFIPKVYAINYDFEINTTKIQDKEDEYKIDAYLKNIEDTQEPIVSCNMNILFYNNLELLEPIKGMNDWVVTTGKNYTFRKSLGTLNDTRIFSLNVKNQSPNYGYLLINDISCQTKSETLKKEDQVIYLATPNTTPECNLFDILINNDTINFTCDKTDYYLEDINIDELNITPILSNKDNTYIIDKIDNRITIKVNNQDNFEETYNIHVIETPKEIPKKQNYIPIFFIIIFLLVVINIIRIYKKYSKRERSN